MIFAIILCSSGDDTVESNVTSASNSSFDDCNAKFEYSNDLISSNESDVEVMINRIVGGFVTTIEKNPWQVSLQRNSRHICGGSIIASKWILSAAHCTTRRQAVGYTVRVGSANRRTGGTVIEVRNFFQHGRYRSRTLDFDFSLVQLKQPLNFTNQIQPIALPDAKYRISEGTICSVSGWGNKLDIF